MSVTPATRLMTTECRVSQLSNGLTLPNSSATRRNGTPSPSEYANRSRAPCETLPVEAARVRITPRMGPDARRPSGGEGHPHDQCRPAPEPARSRQIHPRLAVEPGNLDDTQHEHAEEYDRETCDLLDQVAIVGQELAKNGGRGAEQDEDDRESQHEQHCGSHDVTERTRVLGKLGRGEPRHEGQVAGDQAGAHTAIGTRPHQPGRPRRTLSNSTSRNPLEPDNAPPQVRAQPAGRSIPRGVYWWQPGQRQSATSAS